MFILFFCLFIYLFSVFIFIYLFSVFKFLIHFLPLKIINRKAQYWAVKYNEQKPPKSVMFVNCYCLKWLEEPKKKKEVDKDATPNRKFMFVCLFFFCC